MNKSIEIAVNNSLIKGVLENYEAEKLIILVHGFTGNMRGYDNIFEKLSRKLQNQNYAVIRFSFIGSPPSEGEYIDMTVKNQTEELSAVIDYAKASGYAQIGLLGESMGGTISLEGYNTMIEIMIFWYPTFDFSESSFINYLENDELKELKENGYVLTDGYKIGEKFISQIKTIDVYDKLSEIRCPVLFVHGDSDTDVPFRQSIKGFNLIKGEKQLNIIHGAEHCFINEQEKVIQITVDFLKMYF